jgi:hypothetical protein
MNWARATSRTIARTRDDLRWTPGAPCPCGRPASAAACCGIRGRLVARRTPTAPPLGTDRVAGCYATGAGGCTGVLSREHPITESLLEDMSDGGTITMRGGPWRDGVRLRPASLTARVLCEGHNNTLGAMEEPGTRLARVVRAWNQQVVGGAQAPSLFLVHGQDLERWPLCGGLAAGWYRRSKALPRAVPERWIRILYDLEPMPPTWGLYLRAIEGDQWRLEPDTIRSSVLFDAEECVGTVLGLHGFELVLSMTDRDAGRAARTISPGSLHRPRELRLDGGAERRRVVIGWGRASSAVGPS